MWAFLQGFQVSKNGKPYLDRLRVIQTPWFSVLLHRIHEPDMDRDPHTHPWPFGSFILSGSYTERIWYSLRRDGAHDEVRRPRFSFHIMDRTAAHMITEVEGVLWTLVFTGPRHKDDWGFLGPGSRVVPWREYLNRGEDSDDLPW
jgi:hypothetical protein